MILSRRILFPMTAAIVLGYFFFFNWKSLFLYFDQDDMYNLYMAWNRPLGELLKADLFFWNGFFRPLGAIFYRGLFAIVGFHPLPLRIAALGLCVVNLALCFWFARLVSGSERVGALASLIFAFHTRLMEVWFRTAVVYDVLCFTFVYLAAGLYIAERREGRDLSVLRIAAILACFLCALDAKEMAVCLPILLIAYEVLFNSASPQRFFKSRALALNGILMVMSAIYAAGKLGASSVMVKNPFYAPEYSFARFEQTWSVYLGQLFVQSAGPVGWVSMSIVAGLLLIAVAARSRQLLFAWVVIFFGLLPVSFSPARGGFVIYMSYPGWALYIATVLVAAQDLFTGRNHQYRTAAACAVFVLTGYAIGKINLHDQRADPRPWLYDSPALVHAMADQMREMHPEFPRGAKMLFVKDSFQTDEWTPFFIVHLLYSDPTLTVDRVKMMKDEPTNWSEYQYVFTYEGQRYRQLKPGPESASNPAPASR